MSSALRPIAGPQSSAPRPRELPTRIGLVAGFQYVHEPLVRDDAAVPFLAGRDVIEGLKRRIRNSSGGAFLVTGFRGAGKTTVVLRTLLEVENMEPDTLDYLPVVLNVARPVTIDELLFEVVRRLFEALIDKKVLENLAPDVRRSLVLAYARTSLSFKETRSQSTEVGASLGLGGALPGASQAAAVVSVLAPKFGLSRKKTDSMATEASFLAYSHGDVEHDFVRIIELLNREPEPPASRWRKLVWRLRGSARPAWQGRVVVVLDELDKLTATEEGRLVLPKLLAELKNILTTRHVHFVFVGGPDLHDEAILDATRGNSVYESVFACHLYVPCLWNATDLLLDAVVPDAAITDSQRSLMRGYLDYKARGVPRLLLRELNDMVRFEAERAHLHVDAALESRIAFYARLQSALDDFLGHPDDEDMFTLAIDRDRWRLGAYYIADWILRRRRREFTVSEILSLDEGSAGEWLRNASEGKVQELIDRLVEHGFVRVVWDPATGTIIGDAKQERVYAIVTEVRRELSSFANESERERRELSFGTMTVPAAGAPAAEPSPWTTTDSLGGVQSGRYQLREQIGRGGMGTVYLAFDTRLAREVAIKMLESPALLSDRQMQARFNREAEIARSLVHPGIVTTYEIFEEPDGRLGIVMDYVAGTPLRDIIPATPPVAVAIVSELLDALEYLAERGMARVDFKPENIILADEHPVIIDLGLVKPSQDDTKITSSGVTVGTPSYMSPEQAGGQSLDVRSDIFSLGLVLFELISGEQAFGGDTPIAVLFQIIKDETDVSRLGCSEQLREVVARATAKSVSDRFQSPLEMRAALQATPEAAASA
jgi:Cdc6-like AAA superfamily ATPase